MVFKQSLINPSNVTRNAYWRDLSAIAVALLAAAFTLNTHGQETASDNDERVATSQGVASNALSLTGKTAPPATTLIKPRNDAAAEQNSTAKNHLFNDFLIFDADVTLYFDDDLDGFYYGIDVNFDADTDYAVADVYARLYLSLEGGPWELYYTTEVFTLFGDSGNDDFTVETELYSGYPTAYYDVLIELYDWDTGAFVAEFGPADSLEMADAPLEDQQKDLGIITIGSEPIISQSRGGGGSTSWLGLVLISALLATRRRLAHAS